MRSFSLLSTFVLVATALAGCIGGEEGTPTPTPMTVESTPSPVVTPTPTAVVTPTPPTTLPPLDSSTYQLAVAGMPTQAKPGARFNFTLFANGSVTRASDHIGGHFAGNDTTNPPVPPGRGDCEHQAGDLPGQFVVDCTLGTVGTWYVWGHARINDSGELRNWWPATPAIVKVRNFTVEVSGVPTAPVASKSNFTIRVNVTGTENATSNHLGAHYWNATQPNPTAANSTGACAHLPDATGAIGSWTITCSIENKNVGATDFFLRGHVRVTEGDTTLDWWGEELKVSILGNPLI